MPTTRRFLLSATVLVVVLAACGSSDDAADDGVDAAGTTSPAAAPAADGVAAADVEFAQGMIAHHEQAIEMAEMALDPNAGAGAEVVDLSRRIQAAQDPEIEQMTAWLNAWGEPLTMDMSDGHDMSSMEGMMSVEDMDALAAMTGPDFDRAWLEMMIAHHEGAIAQSETVRSAGSDPAVLALADEIITAQRAEIDEMTALLGR